MSDTDNNGSQIEAQTAFTITTRTGAYGTSQFVTGPSGKTYRVAVVTPSSALTTGNLPDPA